MLGDHECVIYHYEICCVGRHTFSFGKSKMVRCDGALKALVRFAITHMHDTRAIHMVLTSVHGLALRTNMSYVSHIYVITNTNNRNGIIFIMGPRLGLVDIHSCVAIVPSAIYI